MGSASSRCTPLDPGRSGVGSGPSFDTRRGQVTKVPLAPPYLVGCWCALAFRRLTSLPRCGSDRRGLVLGLPRKAGGRTRALETRKPHRKMRPRKGSPPVRQHRLHPWNKARITPARRPRVPFQVRTQGSGSPDFKTAPSAIPGTAMKDAEPWDAVGLPGQDAV